MQCVTTLAGETCESFQIVFQSFSYLALSFSKVWSLRRIARLYVCRGATSMCPSTASCPQSPCWACSWQALSCSSTSRTAITGQQSALAWHSFESWREVGFDKGWPVKLKQMNGLCRVKVNEAFVFREKQEREMNESWERSVAIEWN